MCFGDQNLIVFLSNGAFMQQKVHLNGQPRLVCKDAYLFLSSNHEMYANYALYLFISNKSQD